MGFDETFYLTAGVCVCVCIFCNIQIYVYTRYIYCVFVCAYVPRRRPAVRRRSPRPRPTPRRSAARRRLAALRLSRPPGFLSSRRTSTRGKSAQKVLKYTVYNSAVQDTDDNKKQEEILWLGMDFLSEGSVLHTKSSV